MPCSGMVWFWHIENTFGSLCYIHFDVNQPEHCIELMQRAQTRSRAAVGPHYLDLSSYAQVPGAGRSVFARADVPHGSTVLREQPLVCSLGADDVEHVRMPHTPARQ